MFKIGFEKIAVSLDFLRRYSDSGTSKRLAALAKQPGKVTQWFREVSGLNKGPKGYRELRKSLRKQEKAMSLQDKLLITSPHQKETHYKDLSPGLRAQMREAVKKNAPPKV